VAAAVAAAAVAAVAAAVAAAAVAVAAAKPPTSLFGTGPRGPLVLIPLGVCVR
jgi:hypothetical protein